MLPAVYGLSLPPQVGASDFITGADISFLQQIEDSGGIYREGGIPREALDIFKDHGFNYVRLRLWHSPADGYNDLEHTLAMAARVKAKGYGLLLDFHYSDTWADPGKQFKPAAWEGLAFGDLKDSVYSYTNEVITQLGNQNTLPDIVQVGNEVICGMLWDEGRVCGTYNTPSQWDRFAQLVTEAIRGIEDGIEPGDSVRIMIHIDRGGDNAGTRWFFDNLLSQGVDFDLIGQSFYPWWHGTMTELAWNLNDTAGRYGKDIIVVEAAYPWTLDWYDDTHNIVGLPEQLHPGYPATVDGQRDYLAALIDTIKHVPNGQGIGIFYWSPEYISVPSVGSPWENLTLFDFEGNLLHSIAAFDSAAAGLSEPGYDKPDLKLNRTYPNPFRRRTTIVYELQQDAHAVVRIYDVLGEEVRTLIDGRCSAGMNRVQWDGRDLHGCFVAPGVYACALESEQGIQGMKLILSR
jgi:arabinogalactan endo-1,4-beta-galactosidase